MNFTMPKATGPESFPQKIAVIGDLGQVRSYTLGRPVSGGNEKAVASTGVQYRTAIARFVVSADL